MFQSVQSNLTYQVLEFSDHYGQYADNIVHGKYKQEKRIILFRLLQIFTMFHFFDGISGKLSAQF